MFKSIVLPVIILALLLGFTACATAAPNTATTTTPSSGMPQYRPVEVVGVYGPLTPINPGGPVIEITLRNTGSEPVIRLKATLQLDKSWDFEFPVSESDPLSKDESASSKQTLIGAGFDSAAAYPLKITATLQSGSEISYTVQVTILPPPANSK